jgi:hypothetical protein
MRSADRIAGSRSVQSQAAGDSPVADGCAGTPLGVSGDGRYRVLSEAAMIDSLAFICWPHSCRAGRFAWAREEAALTLADWLADGLPFARVAGEVRLDPYEVINFMKWRGLTRGDVAWSSHVAAGRRSAAEFAADEAQDVTASSRRFEVTLVRGFIADGGARNGIGRFRLPLPDGDDSRTDILSLLVSVPALDHAPEFSCMHGRIEARFPIPREASLVVIESTIAFTSWSRHAPTRIGHGSWPSGSDGKSARYLDGNEGLVQVTRFVRDLAARLAAAARDPWEALEAFWTFFFSDLRSGYIHHDELDSQDPLRALVGGGWFDCYAGSALLVALCRARGIPARLVSGYTLYPVGMGNHFWAEAFLPGYGWLPFDLMCWDLAAGDIASPWSRRFFGSVDFRMKTQVFPDRFIGHIGVRMPASWYLVPSMSGEGVEHAFFDLAAGRLIFRDMMTVRDRSRPGFVGAAAAGAVS